LYRVILGWETVEEDHQLVQWGNLKTVCLKFCLSSFNLAEVGVEVLARISLYVNELCEQGYLTHAGSMLELLVQVLDHGMGVVLFPSQHGSEVWAEAELDVPGRLLFPEPEILEPCVVVAGWLISELGGLF
jgi:hypothetical protein